MRRPVLILTACLMLSGCGTKPQAADVLAEMTPAQPITVPAEVTAGRTPEEPPALPTKRVSLREWRAESRWNEDPVCLLAALKEQDAALYGVTEYQNDAVLLRWGTSLAEFPWSLGGPMIVEPQLLCLDADGDDGQELIVINCAGSGTGVFLSELHVIEKNPDGTLTDNSLPRSAFDSLTEQLRAAELEGRTFAILGTELVDITDRLPENLDGVPTGLVAGSNINFGQTPQGMEFWGGVWLDGEGVLPTACYAADVRARVSYEDGAFTLSGFHLDGLTE